MKRCIAVECWADKYFFGKLLTNEALIRKEKNKSAVIQSILKRSNGNFSVGIIDDDNEQIENYLRGFEIEKRLNICEEIELIKIYNEPYFILQLSPKRFEKWIVKFIEENCNKELNTFGYNSVKEFDDDSKVIEEKLVNNPQIVGLFKFVLDNYKNTDNHIRKMKQVLEYLIEHPYEFDINELKNV